MSWKDHKEDIGLIVDLMVFFGFLGLWLYGQLSIFIMFLWTFSFIITRYLTMKGWRRALDGWKQCIDRK